MFKHTYKYKDAEADVICKCTENDPCVINDAIAYVTVRGTRHELAHVRDIGQGVEIAALKPYNGKIR